MKQTLLDLFRRLKSVLMSYLPTHLPMGMSEFYEWSDSMIKIANFPTNSRDDINYVLATLILHLGPTASHKPKQYFIRAIKAGAAKQIASGVFQEIKVRQSEEAKKRQESTPNTGNSNGVVQGSKVS